jgi:DNA-binding GntR family transcriptional regulator
MTESVYDRLKNDIVLGVFSPGDRLLEAQLAERYSVSRTPVRDALRRLESDGLAERFERSMRVRVRSTAQIHDLYELRGILESAAARFAAERRRRFDEERLRDIVDRIERSVASVEERVNYNRHFHAAVWDASHNALLVETLTRLYTTAVHSMETALADDARWHQSIEEHHELVAAIADQDCERAEAIMRTHMDHSLIARLRMTGGSDGASSLS